MSPAARRARPRQPARRNRVNTFHHRNAPYFTSRTPCAHLESATGERTVPPRLVRPGRYSPTGTRSAGRRSCSRTAPRPSSPPTCRATGSATSSGAQWRGLLLAESRLRPVRGQGGHGRRTAVRRPGAVRPGPDPTGRHRRVRHRRPALRRGRRGDRPVQPVRQRLVGAERDRGVPGCGPARLRSVQALDLLGGGTACLVWPSPLPGESTAPLLYVDLMGGRKAHLMIGTRNNLGAETLISYVPSTRFYVADEFAGTPWVTRLPFPVQVVERCESINWIGRNRLASRYAYHHGYYDADEREYRRCTSTSSGWRWPTTITTSASWKSPATSPYANSTRWPCCPCGSPARARSQCPNGCTTATAPATTCGGSKT
jgi:hypothetical protein